MPQNSEDSRAQSRAVREVEKALTRQMDKMDKKIAQDKAKASKKK